MNHAVWYESPIFNGFQFSALLSPGQNEAKDNSDYAYGDLFQCNGASARGSGSNFPGTGGAIAAISAATAAPTVRSAMPTARL